MENNDISGRTELQLQILQLKNDKSASEKELNQSFNDLTFLIFAPPSLRKDYNDEAQNDKKVLLSLSKIVINKTTDYFLDQNFGKKRKLNEFLASMFIDMLSTPVISQKLRAVFFEFSNHFYEEDEAN